MLVYKQSDIVTATEDIVVNAANGIGWMGGILARVHKFHGIAESINYATKGKVEKELRKKCRICRAGEVFFTNGYGIGKIGIIHAVTMMIPGWWTTEKTVKKLLPKIIELAMEKNAKSIALPYLGCGTGHLKAENVKTLYEEFFCEYPEVEVVVYYL